MSWISWPFRMIFLVVWFAKEIVVSNMTVLRDNLTPGQNSTPGVARYVTRCRTDLEITLLASMITVTPGTLTIGTAVQDEGDLEDLRVLFVHGMYSAGADELRQDLAVMESRMLSALRRKGDSL